MPEPLTMMPLHLSRPARRQRGLSLIELMVGIAVGLVVVAGASFVVATQLTDNRRLLLETQLQQDLRASADIITRELRRSGVDGDPTSAVYVLGGTPPQLNVFADVTLSDSDHQVVFDYRRENQNGPFGFRLHGTAIQSLIGGNWQALTDENTMRVLDFTVTALPPDVTVAPCPKACSADPLDTACWPTLTVRTYQVDISAQALSDATVQRSIRSQVRLRNDLLSFNDPAHPTQACPA